MKTRWKLFGMDLFDVAVHVLVTLGVAALLSEASEGRVEDMLMSGVFASSLALLAWRRTRALAAEETVALPAERVEELDDRIAELEAGQQRILELEERLDFAERLLTRVREAEKLEEGR